MARVLFDPWDIYLVRVTAGVTMTVIKRAQCFCLRRHANIEGLRE